MNRLARLMEQAHAGDKEARDRLVSENLGLVHAVTKRFANRGHDREELFQIGCIGLMKAVDKFDVSLNLAFSTYAVPMIAGEIRRFLRDDGMVRVSRTLKENGYKIGKARQLLLAKLGREPGLDEVAEETGLAVEEIAANIVQYGYRSGKNYMDISFTIQDDKYMLRIRDDGVPFNPLEYQQQEEEEVTVGGIALIKKMASQFQYMRVLNMNNTVIELDIRKN